MKHTTKFTFRDEERFPGVVVQIKKVSHQRRVDLESKTTKYYQKRQEIQLLYAELGNDQSQSAILRRIQLGEDIGRAQNELYKAEALRLFISNIKGLETENDAGETVEITTAEQLIADGPTSLVDVLFALILNDLEMLGDEPKNSQLPITSTEPEDGQVPNTIATPAAA